MLYDLIYYKASYQCILGRRLIDLATGFDSPFSSRLLLRYPSPIPSCRLASVFLDLFCRFAAFVVHLGCIFGVSCSSVQIQGTASRLPGQAHPISSFVCFCRRMVLGRRRASACRLFGTTEPFGPPKLALSASWTHWGDSDDTTIRIWHACIMRLRAVVGSGFRVMAGSLQCHLACGGWLLGECILCVRRTAPLLDCHPLARHQRLIARGVVGPSPTSDGFRVLFID